MSRPLTPFEIRRQAEIAAKKELAKQTQIRVAMAYYDNYPKAKRDILKEFSPADLNGLIAMLKIEESDETDYAGLHEMLRRLRAGAEQRQLQAAGIL